MDYTANAKLLLEQLRTDDVLDDIYDKEGYLDFTKDDKGKEEKSSYADFPQKYPETPEERINWQEQIRMIHLRSHLNQLMEAVNHAQYVTEKTREELKKCQYQIQQHEEERDRLLREIQEKESEGNMSAILRVRAAHDRACRELENEQKLEGVIKERLEQAQHELAVADLERGKFILVEDDLLQKEIQLSNDKIDMAIIRLHKEEFMARQAFLTRRKDRKTREDALIEAERRHTMAIEEAEKSHERANKYLNKTLAKLKKRQQEEQQRYNEDMTRKMDMLLKLKKDIALNRENIRVIRARDKEAERRKKSTEKEEMDKIAAEGGNPEQILLMKKRRNEIEKRKQQFEAEQKVKKALILQKILTEEENMKRKIQQQPYLYTNPEQEKALRVCPMKKKLPKAVLDYIEATADETPEVEEKVFEKKKEVQLDEIIKEDDEESTDSYFASEEYNNVIKTMSYEMRLHHNASLATKVNRVANESHNRKPQASDINKNKTDGGPEEEKINEDDEEEITLMEEETILDHAEEEEEEEVAVSSEICLSEEDVVQSIPDEDLEVLDIEEDEEMQVDLAQPEFEGLWSKKTKPQKDQRVVRPVGATKMEQEILKRTLDKLKDRIVTTQVPGKGYSKHPFYSKPSVIHFKDFTVGKSYKKKVLLTNVTYTVNSIKFVDISDVLKDFIKISFQPPGLMSAGMTCEMTVTFKPMINVELKGEVMFLTKTGPFQIPLLCSTKKCDLTLDTCSIDFGTSVIGESHKRSFLLTNRGALGTKFTFSKDTGVQSKELTAQSSEQEMMQEPQLEMETMKIPLEAESLDPAVQSQTQTVADDNLAAEEYNVPTENEIPEVQDTELKIAAESAHAIGSDVTKETRSKSIFSTPSEIKKKPGEEEESEEKQPTVSVIEAERLFAEEDQGLSFCESTSEAVEVKELDRSSEGAGLPPDMVISEAEELASLDGMRVGPITAGEIGPYSSVLLEIIWKPTIPGPVDADFIVSFSDPLSQALSVHVHANAVDVPVWVERETVDLKICMFDRLYQDTVVINNRATSSLKVQFDVCKELRNHLEILPKTGFIQARSQFSAQLKFLPRQSLFKEAARFFDPETGVLESPVTIIVADKVIPVCFTVQAVVTTTDLEFSVSCIDFGYCTVHESVKQTISLTNKSILPQQFGFVGLPDYMEVQPNDGFGTILPLETLSMDVIFSPKAAKEYKMNLTCRTLINRDFSILCFGIGVLTPLELSEQVIHFSAVPLYDTATVALHVINKHTDRKEYTHIVPRIGKGEIWPVGPTSFEFKVPKGAPITISPTVGTVLPGQKQKVEVRFSPTLCDDDIKLEALKIYAMEEAARQEKEREEAEKREEEEKIKTVDSVVAVKHRRGKGNSNENNLQADGRRTTTKTKTFVEHKLDNQNQNESAGGCNQNKSIKFLSTVLETLKMDDSKSRGSEDISLTTAAASYDESNPKSLSGCNTSQNVKETSLRSFKSASCSPRIMRRPHSLNKWHKSLRCVNIYDSEPEKKLGESQKHVMEGNKKRSAGQVVPLKHHKAMKFLGSDDDKVERAKKLIAQKHEMDASITATYEDNKNNNKNDSNEDDKNNNKNGSNEGDENLKSSPSNRTGSLALDNFPLESDVIAVDEYDDEEEGEDEEDGSRGKRSKIFSKVSSLKTRSNMSSQFTDLEEDSASKLDPHNISPDSREYRVAQSALIHQFESHFESVIVPCYVAYGQSSCSSELNYSIYNTLYLEVHCPTVSPPIMVISDHGRRMLDFGSVPIGQICPMSVTIQNISVKYLELQSTIPNPAGPFMVVNALRPLSPGATHTILLTFRPESGQIYQENLAIKTQNATLHLTLKGQGVSPLIHLNIDNGVFNMGTVLAGDFVTKPFKIENWSTLAVDYMIKLDSLSPLHQRKAQNIPSFLGAEETHRTKNYVGAQNNSGRNVFDIVPTAGIINAGETKEIMVTFAPDHESDLYSDGVRIELFYQEESHFFQLTGEARGQILYLEGCDPLLPPLQSLAFQLKQVDDDDSAAGANVASPPMLLTIQGSVKGEKFEPAIKTVFVGCVKTTAASQRKSGEFTVDGLTSLLQKGFTVHPQKGTVEADTRKAIEFTWLPPAGFDPSSVVEETVTIILKADVTEQIPLVIRAMVVVE